MEEEEEEEEEEAMEDEVEEEVEAAAAGLASATARYFRNRDVARAAYWWLRDIGSKGWATISASQDALGPCPEQLTAVESYSGIAVWLLSLASSLGQSAGQAGCCLVRS